MHKTIKFSSTLCLSLLLASTAARAGSEDFIFGIGAGIIGSAIVNSAKQNNSQRTTTQRRVPRRNSSFSAQTQDTQTRLNMLGFNAGRPDGVSGRRTRNAIKQFQYSIGEYASGRLDNRQIARLYELTTPQQPVIVQQPVILAPAAVAPTIPTQQININVPAPAQPTQVINSTQILAVSGGTSTKSKTQLASNIQQLRLDPANLPSIHGLTAGRFEHDVKGLLEKVGYQSCIVEGTRTTCTLELDTLTETVNVLTQDDKIYGLQREVTFRNPAPRGAIMGKLLKAYPILTRFEDMTATDDSTCRITYLGNSGELLKQALETPSNAEVLRQLSDNCSSYHTLEVSGEDTVSSLRIVFYGNKAITAAIEDRKGAFQISSRPALELTF
ncbi:peptidoglycan-binding domain-containing protein [Pseudovibrio sp. Tun.PSC04-5.I4]|uniref:peptidoglycan-binding domain-containing protein n=1 Tax=Pseudovibrio sp. Tun.PSC04-5.I4 TaxID=1798213 RepID=UPI00087E7529|nr:peptidoglycan-binding domain-containing protein [Pseudovibrio sp. Tun.PSC04-5.I4]SDR08738.1 Putative peptidoglycan binding domain-containing protein [Pseudovibrio sp. Tun.PSC04-5.I4]